MEAVNKRIPLEPFRSRMKSSVPFAGMDESVSYGALNWGHIGDGVDFNALISELGETEAVNLYGKGVKKLGVLTYAEIMSIYASVKNKRVNIDTASDNEIERLKSIVAFVEDKRIIDDATNMRRDPCCDPCASVSPLPPTPMDDAGYYVPSTANISICLVQKANMIGSYTFATNDWEAGKRYFAGDKVIYDGKAMKLKDFDGTISLYGSATDCEGKPMMTGHFLVGDSVTAFTEYQGLSEDLFDDCIVSKPSDIVDMGYIYAKMPSGTGETGDVEWTYYLRPSWGGYTNKFDGQTYFDTLLTDYEPERGFRKLSDYETLHWIVDDKIFSHGEYTIPCLDDNLDENCPLDIHMRAGQNRNIGFSDITLSGLTWESKLSNFKRTNKTVTYYNEDLPGRFNKPDSTVLDLPYIIGTVKNTDTTGEKVMADYLADITVTPDEGEGFVIHPIPGTDEDYDIIADKLLEEYGGGGPLVKFQTLDDYTDIIASWAQTGMTGNIAFRYFNNAEVELEKDIEGNENTNGKYVYNGGEKRLMYEDVYRFTAREASAILPDTNDPKSSIEKDYVFLDIDTISAMGGVMRESIDYYDDYVIFSNITAGTQSVTEGGEPVSPNFVNADYIMEDYQLGISFVANNNDNVYIDRGSATAFERHLRLSEVDTLQDLEEYGNGMFLMKE